MSSSDRERDEGFRETMLLKTDYLNTAFLWNNDVPKIVVEG